MIKTVLDLNTYYRTKSTLHKSHHDTVDGVGSSRKEKAAKGQASRIWHALPDVVIYQQCYYASV